LAIEQPSDCRRRVLLFADDFIGAPEVLSRSHTSSSSRWGWVVGLFKLMGREVVEVTMGTPVVMPGDLVGGGPFHGRSVWWVRDNT
jgi:hypothetical protein